MWGGVGGTESLGKVLERVLEPISLAVEGERRRISLGRIFTTGLSPGEFGRYYSGNS